MIKNIFDYFENLHTKDLPKNEHSIILDNDRVVKIDNSGFATAYGRPNVAIDGTPYHAKKMHPRHPMMEFATGKMYNEIGIPTVPMYSLQTTNINTIKYQLMSQNLHSIQDLIFTIAGEVIKTKDISHYRIINDYKWAIFYDQELKDIFLKYMTPECFEMLGALYLIDELRTEVDRHEDNYFLVKGPNDRKYKGIIALDNELSEVFLSNQVPNTRDKFKDFLTHKYYSYTPLCCSSLPSSYNTRIANVMKLVQDNVLTPKQIKILKAALQYDFPTEIWQAGNQHPFLQTEALPAYDAASQLWEYNRTKLGKELGL